MLFRLHDDFLMCIININQIEFCQLKGCDRGFYGKSCKEICGNCHKINQCFYTNGTCLTGCDDGYQGYLCKTRE